MQIIEVALTPSAPLRLCHIVFCQPTAADLVTLARRGARLVLDLRQPSEDHGCDESALVAAGGMTYRNLPVAGVAGLTPGNVREFARLVDDPANHPLVIHCATANRVGALVALKAAWLDGADTETALALGRRAGMRAIETAVRAALSTPP